MSLSANIGKNIKHYRKISGLTQEELAEKTDLSNTYIAMLECGKRAPSLGALDKFAKALGVPLEYLLANNETTAVTYKNRNMFELTKAEMQVVINAANILSKKTRYLKDR